MIDYRPEEKESPNNEIRVDSGGARGRTVPIVEWGGNSNREEEEQRRYFVENAGNGTYSTTTGNKMINGADRPSSSATVYGVLSKNAAVTVYSAGVNTYAKMGLLFLGYGPSSEDILQHGLIDYITPLKVWPIVFAEVAKLYTTDN